MITGNEPAMPHGAWGQQTGTGLTIRQHFAAMVMQGILSNPVYAQITLDKIPEHKQAEFVSQVAIEQADALISELNKTESL